MAENDKVSPDWFGRSIELLQALELITQQEYYLQINSLGEIALIEAEDEVLGALMDIDQLPDRLTQLIEKESAKLAPELLDGKPEIVAGWYFVGMMEDIHFFNPAVHATKALCLADWIGEIERERDPKDYARDALLRCMTCDEALEKLRSGVKP